MADEIYTYLFEDFDDRESWLKARKEKGLGASDAATMCGATTHSTQVLSYGRRRQGLPLHSQRMTP